MRELLSLTKWFLAGTFYYIKRLTNTRQCGCAVAPWGELAGFVLSDADRFVFIRFSSGTVMAKRRNSRVISASYTRYEDCQSSCRVYSICCKTTAATRCDAPRSASGSFSSCAIQRVSYLYSSIAAGAATLHGPAQMRLIYQPRETEARQCGRRARSASR